MFAHVLGRRYNFWKLVGGWILFSFFILVVNRIGPVAAQTLFSVEVIAPLSSTHSSVEIRWTETLTSDADFQCYKVFRSRSLGASPFVPAMEPGYGVVLAVALSFVMILFRKRKIVHESLILFVVLTGILTVKPIHASSPDMLSDCITPKSQLSFTDTGLDPNTMYHYQVFVIGVNGSQVGSNQVSVVTQSSANFKSPMGVNLEPPYDWKPDWIFVDAFRVARKWLPQEGWWTWDTGEYDKLDLDENGWVRSLPSSQDMGVRYRQVATVLFMDLGDKYPAGQYAVLYDGEGTIHYDWDAIKNQVLSKPGRDVLDVFPHSGIYLQITATDPKRTGNYIRNIRVILPGGRCSNDRTQYCDGSNPCSEGAVCKLFEENYATERFHPYFLRTLSRFKAIRFLNWFNAWDSTISQWPDRSKLTDYTWSNDEKGVPTEVAVELANQLGAYPWINVLPRATDDHIRQQAVLVRNNLNENLKVFVEYSNEIWNGSFGQGHWVEEQGELEWPNVSASGYTKRINWHGKRTAEMCDIWKSEWGPESDRVICVMGAHGSNVWTAKEALDCPLWSESPCSGHGIDAVGIASYFGYYLGEPQNESTLMSWISEPDGGLNKLFQEILYGGLIPGGPSGGAVQEPIDELHIYVEEVIHKRGLHLIAYEGGQHLSTTLAGLNNNDIAQLFINANRDPRMGTAYEKLFGAWKNSGMQWFVHHTNVSKPSKWGSFGLKEYPAQTSTVKFDTVMKFIEDNSCWWNGCE